MANRPGCEARQFSDQMRCERCNVTWDVNDPDEPECNKLKTASDTTRNLLSSLAAPPKRSDKLLTLPDLPLNHLPAFGVQPGLHLSNYPETAFVVITRNEIAHSQRHRNYMFYRVNGEPAFEVDVLEQRGYNTVRLREHFRGQISPWRNI